MKRRNGYVYVTEAELHDMVKESAKRTINEISPAIAGALRGSAGAGTAGAAMGGAEIGGLANAAKGLGGAKGFNVGSMVIDAAKGIDGSQGFNGNPLGSFNAAMKGNHSITVPGFGKVADLGGNSENSQQENQTESNESYDRYIGQVVRENIDHVINEASIDPQTIGNVMSFAQTMKGSGNNTNWAQVLSDPSWQKAIMSSGKFGNAAKKSFMQYLRAFKGAKTKEERMSIINRFKSDFGRRMKTYGGSISKQLPNMQNAVNQAQIGNAAEVNANGFAQGNAAQNTGNANYVNNPYSAPSTTQPKTKI